MSLGDALYSLQSMINGVNARIERVVAGAAFLDRMVETGVGDEAIDEASTLLHGYALTLAVRNIEEERNRAKQLVCVVSRYAESVKGAYGGVANP
jgi:hypothetical protein